MSMTKRHFEMIADAFAEEVKDIERDTGPETEAEMRALRLLAARLVSSFRRENPRFDAGRFIEAAGLKGVYI